MVSVQEKGSLGEPHDLNASKTEINGEVSEIWNQFFKFKFFYVIFFAETSLGYLGISPGPVGMVS